MISIGGVILNKFAIDIASFLLYCASVMTLRVKFLYLPPYKNVGIFKIYLICYSYKEFVPCYFFS